MHCSFAECNFSILLGKDKWVALKNRKDGNFVLATDPNWQQSAYDQRFTCDNIFIKK